MSDVELEIEDKDLKYGYNLAEMFLNEAYIPKSNELEKKAHLTMDEAKELINKFDYLTELGSEIQKIAKDLKEKEKKEVSDPKLLELLNHAKEDNFWEGREVMVFTKEELGDLKDKFKLKGQTCDHEAQMMAQMVLFLLRREEAITNIMTQVLKRADEEAKHSIRNQRSGA